MALFEAYSDFMKLADKIDRQCSRGFITKEGHDKLIENARKKSTRKE